MNLEHLQTFRSECELKFAIIRFYPTTKFQAEFTRMSWRDFLIIPPCYEMQRWMGGVKSSVYDSQLWTFSSSFSSHTIIQLNRINSYQDLVEVPLKVTILHRGYRMGLLTPTEGWTRQPGHLPVSCLLIYRYLGLWKLTLYPLLVMFASDTTIVHPKNIITANFRAVT